MRSLLTTFLLSVCALNAAHVTRVEYRDDIEEIFQSMSNDPDYSLERIKHCLHHTSDQMTKIILLQERAFLYLSMQSPQEALRDLETIISKLSEPSKDSKFALVKAVWMHFAISARLQDIHCMKKDLELLKKWDESFPKVDIHHRTVYVATHTNSYTNVYAFNEMLEKLGLRGLTDPKLITINAGYFESQINEKADHHLVELAAACAFTSSPWGNAAWEYVGSTFAPHSKWHSLSSDNHYQRILRDF
jgi:hypothetical protein